MLTDVENNKWIFTDKRSNILVLRFRVRGHKKQFFMSTGLKDSKRNREIVRLRRDAIFNDIILARFDPTLETYRLGGKKSVVKEEEDLQNNLQQIWGSFTDFQAKQLEQTTILKTYKTIASAISKFPTLNLNEASNIRDYILNKYSHHTAWWILNHLSSCCEWGVNSGIIKNNSFLTMKIPKPKRNSRKEDYSAFNLEQRDLIIKAFELDHLHSYYAPLIKFMFWTGCRPGEAFCLTWADVNSDCTKISINKSCNAFGVLKSTKNGKRRIFPCQPGSKLQKLLLEIKPANISNEKLIFMTKTGKKLNSDLLFDIWNERGSNKYKYLGVVKELSLNGLVPYLKPYAMRHTFATWAIANGSSVEKVAYWIGDNVATVLKYYCHPEVTASECPDF